MEQITVETPENIDKLKWVLRARGVYSAHEYPRQVHVDDDVITCTDSRRMHMVKNTNILKPGLYEVIEEEEKIVLKKVDGKILNYKKVLIDEKEKVEIVMKEFPLMSTAFLTCFSPKEKQTLTSSSLSQ